jgi:trypsin
MDFSTMDTMDTFSDIGESFSELDAIYDYVIEVPDDVANTTKYDEEDARIIGGTTAATSNNKVQNNQVMLLRQTGTNSAGQPTYAPNNCGGTLVTNCHVLTAGHCIGRYGANDAVLVNARNPYDTNNNGAPKWKSTISNEYAHSTYQSGAKPNDIGIIRLSNCVPDNMLSSLPPVKVASSLPSTGTSTVVAGFGRTDPNVSTKPREMQAVTVEMISDSQCTQAYGSVIDNSQFCAGDWSGGKDSCQGDSGGGMYKGTSVSSQELIGVVSWGSGCAVAQKPGVYASVPNFRSWINSNVCNDGSVNTSKSPICGGSYAGTNNDSTTYGSGGGNGGSPDCKYSSSKTVTFTNPNTGSLMSTYCKFMIPSWPDIGGVDYNQFCSVQTVKDTCEFACHSSCPYA